jgi:hypothetical protein
MSTEPHECGAALDVDIDHVLRQTKRGIFSDGPDFVPASAPNITERISAAIASHHEQETPTMTNATMTPTTIETTIAAALDQMRRAAAEAATRGSGDFYDAWTAEALDRPPTILVAVQLPGQTLAWIVDAGDAEGAIEAHVSHRHDLPATTFEGLRPVEDAPLAELMPWSRSFAALAESVSWLVRERTGQHLREYVQARPDPA